MDQISVLMEFKTYCGEEIATVFEPLALLRQQVFREWPYLYSGSTEYEAEYLKFYAQSERAMLFAIYSNGQMVGATTCIPLHDESIEIQTPFLEAGLCTERIFYFGESMLLPMFRNRGFGHHFFDVREQHAMSFGTYNITTFCGVVRPDSHPLNSADYLPLDAFWRKRGYHKKEGLVAYFGWPDIGETENTLKPMQFWIKHWFRGVDV